MKDKLKQSAKPTTIRLLLIIASILIIALTAALAVFAEQKLDSYANDVATIIAKSNDTQKSLDSLSAAKVDLEKQQDIVKKAQDIVADSKFYQYQNQIITDLNSYADRSHIIITSFTFPDPTAKPTTSAADKKKKPTVIAGLKSTQIVIELASPIRYSDFLDFLALIENNTTRMQIQGVSITPAQDTPAGGQKEGPTGPDLINVKSLTLGVFIR